jgi:hypothetical protein
MILIIFIFFVISTVLQTFYFGNNMLKDDIFVEEDADRYYETLSGITQKRLYTRECYHEAEFGNKTMSEEAFE